jgi:hypothetical protein
MTGAGLRVLAVTNMYPTADDPAYGAFVATQVESMVRAGADVEVEFVNGRRGAMEYVRALPRIGRRLKTSKFDVVHAHYGLTGFLAAFEPVPLVVTFYGDDLLGTPDGRVTYGRPSAAGAVATRRTQGLICMSRSRRALPRGDRAEQA